MAYAIRSVSPSLRERLRVKEFKYAEDMHTFLNTGDNALRWREVAPGNPTKAGTYVYAGGKWHNVKAIDPSALAHM